MCLATLQIKPLVAKRAITIYKLMEKSGDKLYSPYQGHIYELGVKQETKITRTKKRILFLLSR